MRRHIIPGETVPLEVFPDLMRTRAREVGAKAIAADGLVPPDVVQVLEASTEDLRVVQLRNMLTYADVDQWAARLREHPIER